MKRAYASEPVLLDSSPVTAALTPRQRLMRSNYMRTVLIAVSCLIFVISGVLLAIKQASQDVPIPVTVAKQVSFPLYQPTWLPEGYSISADSLDATEQVVTFAAKDADATRLVFTEQPKPPADQITSFYNQQLSDIRRMPVRVGEATIGRFEGTPIAGIATEKTWILVRATANIDQDQLQKITEHLSLVQVN